MSPFPAIETMVAAFPTAATVAVANGQLPHSPAVSVIGAWLPSPGSGVPSGSEVDIMESRRVMAFPKAAVPILTSGSIVTAAGPEGGAVKTWRVAEEAPNGQPDEVRAYLLPVEPEFP